jgi:Ca2+/Na+ antiporter
MHIPNGAIIPLFIVSFVMLAVQYFRIDPERRVVNLRFGLMVGAVVLMFATIFLGDLPLSPVFFLLALFWLGLTLYLFRLPPPRH